MDILSILFLICLAVAFVAFMIWVNMPKKSPSKQNISAIAEQDLHASIREIKIWNRFLGITTIIGIIVGVIIALSGLS